MKKLVSLLLATMLLLTCIPLGTLSVSAYTSGGYTYTISNGEATITDYTGSGGAITIPSTLGGYPVTSIDDDAFYKCTSLTSVTIGDGVTSIGEYAFYDCESLTSVTIPDSATSIGFYAFGYCSSLTSVCISDLTAWCGIDFEGYSANPLSYAHNLYLNGNLVTDLVIPDSVTSIGDYAFRGCTSLTSVTIPDSVTSIGGYAFYGCSRLTSVTMGDGVTSIGDYAFYSCDSLTSVTIPNSVTSIGEAAFLKKSQNKYVFRCYKNSYTHTWAETNGRPYALIDGTDEESIVGGKVGKLSWSLDKRTGVLAITGSGAMVDFSSADAPWRAYEPYVFSAEIDDSITSIGDYAFNECYNLTSVVIPDSVTSIGDRAFYYCSRLTSVVIPDSVTSIGYEAFRNCASLTSVHITDLAAWCEIDFNTSSNPLCHANKLYLNGNPVTDLVIPDSVTSIGDYAFRGCTSLTSVTIPESVTSIGGSAFSDCSGLTSLTIPYKVEYIGSHCFSNCSSLSSVTIYSTDCSFDDCGLNYNHTIYGFVGSTAEAFAEKIGAEFIDVETVHTHSYSAATCTTPKTCKVCGKTSGKALGHKYSNACDTTCNTCKATRKITHKYSTVTKKATTTANGYTVKRCSVCDKETGKKTLYKVSSVTLSKTSYTYNGKVQKPTVTVKNANGVKLTEGTSYTVTYSTGCKNAGTYKVTIKLKGNYSGTVTKTFKITPQDVSKCKITLSTTSYTYNGAVKKPTVTVKNAAGTKLTLNGSYTVTYASGRKNVGTYKVTVKMKGNYTGTKTITFKILPAKTSISSLTAGTKKLTVKWAKKTTQVTGYQIQYSTSKSFSSAKTKTITKNSTVSTSLTGLSAKKTYYVRIRTYKTVNGVKIYSGWSTVKSLKTK